MTDKLRVLDASPQSPIAKTEVTSPADVSERADNTDPARGSRTKLKRLLLPIGAAVMAAAVVYYGHGYWTVGRFQVETDDAYVKADSGAMAPKVSGYLTDVLVADNEPVTKGQQLAVIDDRDYRTALDQANADVMAAGASLDAARASLDIQKSNIAAAQATLDVDRANEVFAEQNNKRYASLATNGYAPVQTAQQAASQIAIAKATIARDEAALETAKKQVLLLTAQVAQAAAALDRSKAQKRQADLNLDYTKIISPMDGVVGNRTLRSGQYVQAGTQLMSIVPNNRVYVVANYKETQLTDVRVGQPVEIKIDMYPNRLYHGKVESVAPASGQEFALLPPDNATGNFTKIVQRIPVRIVFDSDGSGLDDLRPGMSVQPAIDIRSLTANQGTAQ
ncbi:HlyD family secretion protein [Rhizobium sp. ZW T2_16]|uniref:HlyD family secretion protein n=1 Tax=Rhizobium sp. ZW T2_16 TaxID=3378083 RepID=UPI003852FE8B